MNPDPARIAPLVIIILVALMLFACVAGIYAARPHLSPTTSLATPTPGKIGSPDPAAANRVNLALIAQAQVVVDGETTQTAQAAAALTAYPLTATPLAATQSALLLQQYDREQKAFVDRIVSPAIPIVATILLLLVFILVISLVYRRVMPSLWTRRLRIGRVNAYPPVMIEGVLAEHTLPLHQIISSEPTPAALPMLPCENTVHVEIVTATEAPVAHWIAEVEQQLANAGGL